MAEPNFKTTLTAGTAKSLLTYAEGMLEAFATAKITNHLEALTETDAFPRLMKIPNTEWMIGWLHGLAEAHGVTVKALWAEALRMIAARDEKADSKRAPARRKAA